MSLVGRTEWFHTVEDFATPVSQTDSPEPDEPLVGLAEVAELLDVSKRTATSYSHLSDFPEPLQRLAATPVWRRQDVAAWAKVRLPLTRGRPRQKQH